MKNLRKAAVFAALSLVVAGSLLTLKPIVAWATVQGAWLQNVFLMQGPMYVNKSRIGGAQGIIITTGTYSGASQAGVPAAPTGVTPLWLVGGQTSAQRTTCAAAIEGQIIYDPTVHSIAFCDGTVWHKLVTGSGANDSWTTY